MTLTVSSAMPAFFLMAAMTPAMALFMTMTLAVTGSVVAAVTMITPMSSAAFRF
jgi:hypothetical protein